MRTHVVLAILVGAATHVAADEPPVRVVVELREAGNDPAEAEEHARARGAAAAVRDFAAKRVGTTARDPVLGLLLDLVGLETAGIAPGDPEVLGQAWDSYAKVLKLDLAYLVDPAQIDTRWARLMARAQPPTAALGFIIEGRISDQRDAQTTQAIVQHLAQGKFKVVDARKIGRASGEPERDVVARAKGTGIDVLVLGGVTSDYDQGGMTYSIGLDAYTVADGKVIARVHQGRRVSLAQPSDIAGATRRIAADVAAPQLRGRLVRALAMADAALAIAIDGMDADGAKAVEAALRARDDITGLVAPKLTGKRFTVLAQGSFSTDTLVAALVAGSIPLAVAERGVDSVVLARLP